MRVLVVGAGAIGGYFGGRLVQAGRDVTFLVRPRRAEQIRKNGFAIRVAAERADLAVRAIVSEQIEASYDLMLVSGKAYDLESAMQGFAPDAASTGCRQAIDGSAVWTFRDQLLSSDR